MKPTEDEQMRKHHTDESTRDANEREANECEANEREASERDAHERDAHERDAHRVSSSHSALRVALSRPALHAAAVVAFYSVVFTVFFSPILFSHKILAPGDGFNFHAPFFYAGRTLWQPLLWGGYPLAADPQAMTFYPVALLFALVPRGYDAFIVSAYVLAAAFAYGYAFRLTRSVFAALAGGLIYGMCGFLSAQLGHVSLVHTAAWAPAIFWSLEELRRRASAFWFAACAAAVACAGLAGHFQIFTYALGLALLYTLTLTGLSATRSLRRTGLMLSSLALGVAASSVQLVPTYELTQQGQRVSMSFTEFVSFSLPPRHLVRLLFPYAFGGSPGSFYATPYFDLWGPPVGGWGATELAIYVGVLPLALACVGLIAHRRERVAWFWAAAALLALALSAGDALPLARAVFHLPAYNKFRVPARHLFELALATSALASLGIASIERRTASTRLIRLTIIITGCSLALTLFALFALTGTLRDEATRAGVAQLSFAPWRNTATLVPLVVLINGAFALLFWSRRTTSGARRTLLLVAIALDLASFGWFYEWRFTSPDAAMLAPPANAARYAELLRDTHQRMLPTRGVLMPREGSPPNVSALWKVPSASGYSALILARTSRLLDMTNDGGVAPTWQNSTDRSLDLFAVRYVAAPREEDMATQAGGPTQIVSQGVAWSASDLGVALGKGCDAARPDAAEFTLPAHARADSVALVGALACSAAIKDDAPVLRITATDDKGEAQTQLLRAGADTSEWAHDCADVLPTISHRRAQVFESYTVEHGGARCEGHSYLARVRFQSARDIKSLRLEWIGGSGSIDVKKISLIDETSSHATPVLSSERVVDPSRWHRAGDAGGVAIFENLRARPRAWLASEVLTLAPDAALASIKTSRLPDGHPFDPARTALVEESANADKINSSTSARTSTISATPDAATDAANAAGAGVVSIVRESDTALGLRVSANADSFLVLSDAYYPGWRATVDGREARIYQTDYALRGVRVPVGEHAIEFTYKPRSLRVGALVTALSVLAVVLVSLLLARRGRTRMRNDYKAGADES
jgi:hypothetical protein